MNHLRRSIVLALVVLVAGIAGIAHSALAQDATPVAADHPLIGAWIVDPETDDPSNAPSFDIFMSDGTLVNVGSDGTLVGAWASTGPTTAVMTFTGLMGDQGSEGMFVIRADIEVADDGQSFTASHVFMMLAPDGSMLGAFPGSGSLGTRMSAEGTDMGDQPLPGFQSWTPAAPEATPAA